MSFQSVGTREFWRLYHSLPESARIAARKSYRLWIAEPWHPSLHFKKIGRGKWSVRVGIHYRAVGGFSGKTMVWEWIGTHAEYDRL